MSTNSVCLVTAFGRGETLAAALRQTDDQVTTLDFTEAFGPEYSRDVGPYPVALTEFMPAQTPWLGDMRPLPRGLTFWMKDGPIELAGDMAVHFAASLPAVKNLLANQSSEAFADDWLRRFVDRFASPFHSESWEGSKGGRFPYAQPLGLPPGHRESVMLANGQAVRCQTFEDIQFANGRLLEIAVGTGRTTAFRADQWVWCLSSRETEILNAQLAPRVFSRGIYRPEWNWVSFEVKCVHGPWLDGMPEHVIVIDDVYLPWEYANVTVLRRRPGDVFQAWVRLPVDRAFDPAERARFAVDIGDLLNRRLNLARWEVNPDHYAVCPHTPTYGAKARDQSGAPPWKNWDWIAPDNLPRLDWSARLEREAQSYRRLEQWRRDQLKKRGVPRDHTIHAP